MGKDAPVGPNVIKMIGYLDNLQRLDAGIGKELATDIVLQSLNSSYGDFILNFNMHNLTPSLTELHEMLKTAETTIKKAPPPPTVLMVQKGKSFKKQGGKGKSKAKVTKSDPKPTKVKVNQSEHTYHYCSEKDHWKRNCKKFLEDLKKGIVASTSGPKKQ